MLSIGLKEILKVAIGIFCYKQIKSLKIHSKMLTHFSDPVCRVPRVAYLGVIDRTLSRFIQLIGFCSYNLQCGVTLRSGGMLKAKLIVAGTNSMQSMSHKHWE